MVHTFFIQKDFGKEKFYKDNWMPHEAEEKYFEETINIDNELHTMLRLFESCKIEATYEKKDSKYIEEVNISDTIEINTFKKIFFLFKLMINEKHGYEVLSLI